jgi:hypothetical protein
MEKQQGHFVIAEPCHEDWNKMTPESKGRFCDSCQKCVVDFSKMSHHEMLDVYQKAGGDVCARVTIDQIGGPKQDAQTMPARSILSKLQKFALAMLLAFGLAGFSAKAQTVAPVQVEENQGHFLMGDIMLVEEGVVRGKVESDIPGNERITVSLRNEEGRIQTREILPGEEFVFLMLEDGTYYLSAHNPHGSSASRQVVVEGSKEVVQNLVLRPRMMGKVAFVPDKQCPKPKELASGNAATSSSVEVKQGQDSEYPAPEIEVQQHLELKVFPNPSNDLLKLKLLSEPQGPMSVWIFDLEGKLVLKESLSGERGQLWNLDVSKLGMGTYLLEFRSGKARKREKILLI